MATSFPTALDALTNPTPNDMLSTGPVLHTDQHANANDAIEALQLKVGIDSSADTASIDYKLANHTHGHGALTGLSGDDHTQYALQDSVITAVSYTAGGTTTIALNGRTEHFTATAATGSTTWAITGAPAGKSTGFILDLTNGGSQTQNWPAGSEFDGSIAPALTAAGKDRLVFQYDGSVWAIALAMADFK